MKNLLASFLIIAMLAATMVCGCPHESQASSHADHHHSDGSNHHHENSPTVAKDCSGTDMQLPAQISVNKSDLKHNFLFDDVLTGEKPTFSPILASGKSIRGPPPDWPSLSQTHPSFLRSTQRFLI